MFIRRLLTRGPKVFIGVAAASVFGGAAFGWAIMSPLAKDVQVLGVTLVKGTRPALAAPKITSGPSGPTASSTATFTYTHAEPLVSFACSLDGAPFVPCPASSETYTGLPERAHAFEVVAQSPAGSVSKPARSTWSVDITAPTTAVAFPSSDAIGPAGWTSGCRTEGICGSASDATGVQSVAVAVQHSASGLYLRDGTFSSPSPVFNPAAGTASWRLGLARPLDGAYLVRVQATDFLGNGPASGTAIPFSIDSVVPGAPTLTSTPDDPTSATSAWFDWTGDRDATFTCQLDGSAFVPCASGVAFEGLKPKSHAFGVRAVDPAGNASSTTAFSWLVVEGVNFTITGAAAGPLAPGVEQPIDLAFSNPYAYAIVVDKVSVQIAAVTSATCSGTDNLRISRAFTGPVTVPSHGTFTMSATVAAAQRPAITMLDLLSNQDGCKNTTITLRFAGIASKA